ncbi:hypothetical protein SFRURICE_017320 [Spodoptera frugiperda]|nr:hypothetical protein SFRURICE_017320 [Spodoptera frugiperda]
MWLITENDDNYDILRRKRCILRYIMPPYNVHSLFTICVKAHVIRGEPIAIYTGGNSRLRAATEKFSENLFGFPVKFCSTRESNPRSQK